MRIATIIGARPQFIKAAPLSIELSKTPTIEEISIHTGQHFDENMSGIFFRELDLPAPAFNLNISGGSHGQMTGRMLERIEAALLQIAPDAVLVYGDTNSTLAGGLAAAKMNIPVIHVEAGLRSFNRRMPEEINRVLVDHLSVLLFCPTSLSVRNLEAEGITKGVHQVGDLMHDATLQLTPIAERHSSVLEQLGLEPNRYAVATFHRQENTDNVDALHKAVAFLKDLASALPLVMPLHPRTRHAIAKAAISLDPITVTDPMGYFDMLVLMRNARLIATDSGGIQKEAYFHRVPCITMRSETEWVETIECGWNRLWTQADYQPRKEIAEYGAGDAAASIVKIIAQTDLRR